MKEWFMKDAANSSFLFEYDDSFKYSIKYQIRICLIISCTCVKAYKGFYRIFPPRVGQFLSRNMQASDDLAGRVLY